MMIEFLFIKIGKKVWCEWAEALRKWRAAAVIDDMDMTTQSVLAKQT